MIYDSELVEKTLRNLGDDATQVGQSLMDAGIQAIPLAANHCAIARYLSAEIGGTWLACESYVQQDDAVATDEIDTPPHIAQFMKDFDHGYWPQLEEK